MRSSVTRLVRGSSIAFLVLFLFALCAGPARAADCGAGTLITVVAHLDDDLLFVDPAINERLDAGWCVTTVHLIGGANGADFAYVQTRERASRLAYARMAGVPDEWAESNIPLAGKLVHQMVLKAKPQVRLLELRLPGGGVRGGRVPLGLLWEQRATLFTYPMNGDGTGRVKYDRDSLSATLRAILAQASQIYTLNPDTVPFIEHPDHIFAARITRHVAQTLGKSVPIVYHVTYPTGGWPANLAPAEVQRKRDIVASYFSIDGSESSHVFGEFQWDGNWVARRYAFADYTGRRVADFQAHPMQLFNAAASRCVTSAGAGAAPTLAACDGSAAQQWRWEPLSVYPGNTRNAALVSVATSQCIAERDGYLVSETCDQWDTAQRWTPWDFGLVYTPQRHCLGESGGKLTMRGCTSLTTRFRWAARQQAQANDLRLATAMYGDITGTGDEAAVYVQRQHDGPGFNVYAASLTKAAPPVLWYASAVPFDPRATAPSCTADSLCFDSARFVLGDFDGDGKQDLMVITARQGGTAFWLLRSTGERFDVPRLWLQTTSAFKPELTQQYVAADFAATRRAGVLIAQKRSDSGLDLWVAASQGTTGLAPKLVAQARTLQRNADFLPLQTMGSRVSLVAVESVDGRLALTPIRNNGARMTIGERRPLPARFVPGFVKTTIGAVHGKGSDTLILLSPHLDEANDDAMIDIATLDMDSPASVPVESATLHGMAWSDVFPAFVRDQRGAALVLYRRADATLGDFYFTGGAPALSRYPYASGDGFALGAAQELGELPGLFSETVRVDRLAQ
ncbi:putative carbohydrate-binding protein [Paraburkholderia ribeironis]|uniref:Putative carbohydrate-binding protein n=1 Tax=Paraburkholderia ribeironis TaxID=1247936 RepID=A0A1N7S6A1_9BURK|nr:PIG-L family deacetylase [Paraburkholderia ribeironis]SIT42846.1 putative carbohydrate-binding protein [Paraburkholderia ribeironis]